MASDDRDLNITFTVHVLGIARVYFLVWCRDDTVSDL